MPDRTYRLCGFASGVDRRSVTFKEPLPPTRVCNLCGLVAIKMAILPCGHALCSACLKGCTEDDGHSSCAMDKTSFELDVNVCWISAPRDHLAKLQVSCWNAQHGCDFEGPFGELLEHFEKQCIFHETSCPQCADGVLCKDMPTHYRAKCSGSTSSQGNHQSVAAVNTAGGMQKPDTVSCSYHDILASIQSRANEIAETLDGLSTRLVAYTQESNVPNMTSLQSRVNEIAETLDGLSTRLVTNTQESNVPNMTSLQSRVNEIAERLDGLSTRLVMNTQESNVPNMTSVQSRVNEIAETLDSLSTRLVTNTQEANVPNMTSMQRVNEIAETLEGLNTRPVAYSQETKVPNTENGPKAKDLDALLVAFNEMNAALTEGFSSLKQSLPLEVVSALPQSLEKALITSQRVLAPGPGKVACSSASDAVSSGTKIDPTIMYAVLSIVPDDWREDGGALGDLQFVKEVSVYIGQHRTGVDIACLLYREANFIAVYTGLVEPVEWDLLTVRPLSPSDLTSPSLKDFCVLYAEKPPDGFCWSKKGKVLRCLSFLKTPNGKDKTKIDFVLEFKQKTAARR